MPEISYEQASKETASPSNYVKFEKEKTQFRVVSLPAICYKHSLDDVNGKFMNAVCPNFNGKVFKVVAGKCPICDHLSQDDVSQSEYEETSAKKTIVFKVFNRDTNSVQILEKWSIVKTIIEHAQDENWGDPSEYDFVVTKKGSGKQTQYTTVAVPKRTKLSDDDQEIVDASDIDLEKLTTPQSYAEIQARLNGEKNVQTKASGDEIDIEDVPLD